MLRRRTLLRRMALLRRRTLLGGGLLLVLVAGCKGDPSSAGKTPGNGGQDTGPAVDPAPDEDSGAAPVEGIDVAYVELRSSWLPEALPAARSSPVFVDLDGDGLDDLLEATELGVLWHRRAADAFLAAERIGEVEPVTLVAAGDLDADGSLELLVGGDFGVRVVKPAARWPAEEPVSTTVPRALELVDADGDGDLDLLLLGAEGLTLLSNDGAGAFSPAVGPLDLALDGGGLVAADLDGDGHTDVFIGGRSDSDRLYLGDGRGGFLLSSPAALPAASAPGTVAPQAADLDADGDLDLFLPSTGADRLWLNDGQGFFVDETPFRLGEDSRAARDAAVVDLDLDGRLDLVVAEADGPVRLLHQDSSGRFFDWSGTFPGAAADARATGLAVTDLEGDGDPDLFVGRSDLRLPWMLVSWAPTPLQDADFDGVPDEVDVCPEVADPLQDDRDAHAFYCTGAADCADRTGCTLLAPASGSLYLWCADAAASWEEAERACAERGGRQVKLESEEEQEFLLAAGVGGAWLGLTDAEAEGSWRWSDGGAVGFSSWAEGEPNDAGAGEDCASLRSDGTWNDLGCGAALAFVCEATAPATPLDPGDACDTCPDVPDPDQQDTDGDGLGDACDPE